MLYVLMRDKDKKLPASHHLRSHPVAFLLCPEKNTFGDTLKFDELSKRCIIFGVRKSRGS